MLIPFWAIGKSEKEETTIKSGGAGRLIGGNTMSSNTQTMATDGGQTVNNLGLSQTQLEQIKKYGLIAGAVVVAIYILRG